MVRVLVLLLFLAFPAWAEGNLKLTILADKDTDHPVVGEMVNITIRAVYDRKIALEKLEIAPTDAFDWIQTRADDWHEEMIDGLPWIVMERHMAIWPKRAGLLHFGPVRHHLTIITKGDSQRQDVVVEAKPLALSVGEFPSLHGWHLAAKQVELTDHLSADAARMADGDTLLRTVTLRALGVLPEHLPPRPVVSEVWLITFAPPVKRNLTLTADGPVAEVVWTWQLRPHTGEPGVLEAVKIPFYDTAARHLASVEIPALPIGVASFFTGQVPTGRVGAEQIALLAGVVVAALAGGLALAAMRLAPDTTAAGWAAFRRHWSPLPRLRLWQARRGGDLLAIRRAADEAGLAPEKLALIDRKIYGRPEA